MGKKFQKRKNQFDSFWSVLDRADGTIAKVNGHPASALLEDEADEFIFLLEVGILQRPQVDSELGNSVRHKATERDRDPRGRMPVG